MSTTTSQEQQPRQGGSTGFIIAAILIILTVLVTGVVLTSLNLSEPDDPDPVYPIEPDPDPDPDPQEFIEEGEYYFSSKYEYNSEYKFANTAIIRSWDDVEEYFNHLDNIISEAYANSENFDFDEHTYLLVRVADHYCGGSTQAVGITEIRYHNARVLAEQYGTCGVCASEYEYWLIEIDDYDDISSASLSYTTINTYTCDPYVSYKPVIYLYPTKDTEVSVKLGAKEKLLVSYPTYTDGWKVLATPEGKLTDLKTGRGLYSLYYEADNTATDGVHEDGFIVKGSDTVSFLEEKLAKLGLSDTEAEEFIVYWLPQMQDNAYNYIYFAIGDDVAKNMPLDVSPVPSTVIRINMEWKALDAPISVREQKLPETPTRKGFTLVEWGGTILK